MDRSDIDITTAIGNGGTSMSINERKDILVLVVIALDAYTCTCTDTDAVHFTIEPPSTCT